MWRKLVLVSVMVVTAKMVIAKETITVGLVAHGEAQEAIAAWQRPEKVEGAAPAPATTEPQVTTEPDPAPAPSSDVEYHETPTSAPVADAAQVFGAGNAGGVLPGEIELAQQQAGELPLGDAAPRRARNAIREGA